MSHSAKNRPNRSLKKRRWRETYKYRQWRKNILFASDFKCCITGLKKESNLWYIIYMEQINIHN